MGNLNFHALKDYDKAEVLFIDLKNIYKSMDIVKTKKVANV